MVNVLKLHMCTTCGDYALLLLNFDSCHPSYSWYGSCRCLNARAQDFVKDNLCLCGVGSIKAQTKKKDDHIIFATYENEVKLGGCACDHAVPNLISPRRLSLWSGIPGPLLPVC